LNFGVQVEAVATPAVQRVLVQMGDQAAQQLSPLRGMHLLQTVVVEELHRVRIVAMVAVVLGVQDRVAQLI